MKTLVNKIIAVSVLMTLSACSLDDIENPNAPTLASLESGSSQQELRLLVSGTEAVIRNDLEFHYETISIIGREYYDLTGVDPRYTGELLVGPLDNNGFLTTRAYSAWYKVVQSSNLLITSVENSVTALSDGALDGYLGFARTMKAYALLMVSQRQFSNGIRIDVNDPENLGPFLGYDAALTEIANMLNDANTELANAASDFAAGEDEFDFSLSSGFAGFDTPSTFAQFNRAIAARLAIYQNNKAGALSLLGDSFLDEGASLDLGAYHVFGLTGNDIANNLFYVPDLEGQEYMAHPSFEADAEMNDTRVTTKTDVFDPDDDPDLGPLTITFDDLSGSRQVSIYGSNVDPVPIIRNEELLLIYAEANIGTNNTEAIRVLDIIRNAAGLPNYSGGTSDAEVEVEMLNQRRYSLFGEGHRWIDMRRYNRLDELPTDRDGDAVLPAFPTPFAENQ